MSIREMVMQLVALGLGFFGGMMAMRESYLGIIRGLKKLIKEQDQEIENMINGRA